MADVAPTSAAYYFSGDPALPFDVLSGDSILAVFDRLPGAVAEAVGDTTTINGELVGHVDIDGPVFIGDGARIHSGVSLRGPVWIGRNSSVRHGSLIRAGTMIGDECVVGHDAEIKASLCMSGSKMQSGVFVGDSLLGLGTRLGSGTILSNRRFAQDPIRLGSSAVGADTKRSFLGAVLGDNVRLGANVVTAPGTMVGPFTWVSSLVSLYGFVERTKLVLLRQDLEFRGKDETPLRSGFGEYETA